MQSRNTREAAGDRGLPRSRVARAHLTGSVLALILAGTMCAARAAVFAAPVPEHPDRIVLVSIDGLGNDWAVAGRMPHLAKLLAGGERCERGWSPSILTYPALVVLLTGRSHPAAADSAPSQPPSSASASLAARLARRGYRGLALPADPFAHVGTGIADGFTRFAAVSPALAESARVDSALAWLSLPGRRFAWLGLSFGEARAAWRREDGPAFADSEAREAKAHAIDVAIDRLAAGIEQAGLAHGTLLAVVGTHGLPADKSPRGVPIVFLRSGSRGGRATIPGDATLLDVAPTLIRAAGGSPAGLPGRALTDNGAAGRGPTVATGPETRSPCRDELVSVLGKGSPTDSLALSRLHALAQRCPDDSRVAIEEADAVSRAHHEKQAAQLFLAVRARWPNEHSAALAYAQHLVRYKRYPLVAVTVSSVPRNSPLGAEAAWLEVTGLAGELRFAEASRAAREAMALIVPTPVHLQAPAVLDSLREAERLAEDHPDDPAANIAFGRRLGEYGLTDEAYRRLHRARLADTSSAEPDYWIATFLAGERRFKPAADTYARALQNHPDHRPSRVGLAEVLIEMDRWQEAIPHLERAVAQDPTDGRSGYNLACLLARDGRTGPALEALRKALAAGYADREHLAEDPDLGPLRDLPEFRALLAGRPGAR